jgi:hypothetical protein
MPSKLKPKHEYKCRYDELATQLLAAGTNIHKCTTDQEVLASNNKCIELAKRFIDRVSLPKN